LGKILKEDLEFAKKTGRGMEERKDILALYHKDLQ